MVLKAKEIRGMTADDRQKKLHELREDLMHERGMSAMGGSTPSPGKIRQLRTQIARLLTVMREEGELKNE
jgi:large subunit ribosomal protein L29